MTILAGVGGRSKGSLESTAHYGHFFFDVMECSPHEASFDHPFYATYLSPENRVLDIY